MQKNDNCYYCKETLSCPVDQSIVQCKKCSHMSIFLCHLIPPQQSYDLINCLRCGKQHVAISCQQCGGFDVYDHFYNGMKYKCKCGFMSTFLKCAKCKVLLNLQGKKSYQKIQIMCKKCECQFHYKICQNCKACIYKQSWDTSQAYICPNSSCQNSNVPNPYDLNAFQSKSALINRVSKFEQQINKTQPYFKAKTDQSQLCKICLNNDSNMINLKCYHLAVCQECSKSLKSQCPICRSVGGQYKKIYKA